jgi:hypothetical protein
MGWILARPIPQLFCSVIKFIYVFVDTWTLKIANTSMQKIPFVSWHGVKVYMWCVVCNYDYGPVHFSATINLHWYATHILTPFFEHLFIHERTYALFHYIFQGLTTEPIPSIFKFQSIELKYVDPPLVANWNRLLHCLLSCALVCCRVILGAV